MNETETSEDRPPASEGGEAPSPVTPSWDASAARRTALYALLAYLAFDLLLPLIPTGHGPKPLIVVLSLQAASTIPFMLLQLWLAQSVVSLKPRPLVSLALTFACVMLWFVTLFFVFAHADWPETVNTAMYVLRPLLLGLTITLAFGFFGILLSRIIREPNVLLPVALVAMPIDYLGAMTPIGFTQNAVTANPALVRALSVPVPSVGSVGHHHAAIHPIAFIGPGDALFMAFFFAVVLRLDLNVRGTFWWMYGLLTATMLLVLFAGLNVAALIPMGLAVLIANGRFFRLKRDEVFATLYAGLLILALVVGFYAYSHSHFFAHKS